MFLFYTTWDSISQVEFHEITPNKTDPLISMVDCTLDSNESNTYVRFWRFGRLCLISWRGINNTVTGWIILAKIKNVKLDNKAWFIPTFPPNISYLDDASISNEDDDANTLIKLHATSAHTRGAGTAVFFCK